VRAQFEQVFFSLGVACNMSSRTIKEIRDELNRLMSEQTASLKQNASEG